MMGLTKAQYDCALFIQNYVASSYGVAPSYDEIAEALGLRSKSGVYRIISALTNRGVIRKLPGKARAIEILKRVPDRNHETKFRDLFTAEEWAQVTTAAEIDRKSVDRFISESACSIATMILEQGL